MDQTTQPRRSGPYTANLLGNIRSHLTGLQGYDVMALELIQNADDARAEEIIFDITDRGLLVRNSGRFTYCGDLRAHPCGFMASNNYSCDYHCRQCRLNVVAPTPDTVVPASAIRPTVIVAGTSPNYRG